MFTRCALLRAFNNKRTIWENTECSRDAEYSSKNIKAAINIYILFNEHNSFLAPSPSPSPSQGHKGYSGMERSPT